MNGYKRMWSKSRISYGWTNTMKCSKGRAEKFSHRYMKFLVCNLLWENNIEFMTEVTFTGGGRADIVLLDYGIAIEILNTEKKTDGKNYPMPVIEIRKNSPIEAIIKDILTLGEGALEHYNK